MKKKIVILGLALVLAFALGIGGTLAWLTAQTGTVTNTFTVGDINITLNESKIGNDGKALTGNEAEKVTSNAYKLVPGYTYCKDPTVTVKANSEPCYLFVKFEEKNSPSTYLTYTSNLTVANGWTQGTGTGEGKDGIPTNVWYREVTSNTNDQSWLLLAEQGTAGSGIHVKVKDTLTKAGMPAANAAPELVYTAYACQLYSDVNVKFDAKDAWDKVNPAPTT